MDPDTKVVGIKISHDVVTLQVIRREGHKWVDDEMRFSRKEWLKLTNEILGAITCGSLMADLKVVTK
jgi:hypothetical protein